MLNEKLYDQFSEFHVLIEDFNHIGRCKWINQLDLDVWILELNILDLQNLIISIKRNETLKKAIHDRWMHSLRTGKNGSMYNKSI